MCEPDQLITVAIRPCGACGAGLFDGINFCRLCGARQLILSGSISTKGQLPGEAGPQASRDDLSTTRVSRPILYHPISGPLVRAVASGVPAAMSQSPAREFPKRMLLALMTIPIWVMIILLSPIDAYTSAKIIGQRI